MIKEETLRKKGWSEEEIKKAMKILQKERQMFFSQNFAPHIYWVSLLLTIIGNISITFGSLFNILLKDIEMVDPRHHVIVGIFMPAIALTTMWVMIDVTNTYIQTANASNANSPILISAVYALGFAFPSIIQAFAKKR
jgi:hypothetical protein